MNKWKLLLFVVMSVLLLAACGIQSVEQHEKMQDAERSIEAVSEPLQEAVRKEEPVAEHTAEKAVPIEQAKQEVQPAKVETKEEAKPESKVEGNKQEAKPESKVEGNKQEAKPEPKVEGNKQEVKPEPESKEEVKLAEPKEEVKPAPVKEEPVRQAVEPPKEEVQAKKRTVTIAIYVHSLVANLDKLHPSLKGDKYVPASGVILKPVTYELLSEKDTVWDILKRATKEHKIQLEYEGADENMYDSVYIEGINHLYEFSAGPLSGWMYKVNGTFPNYGASQYTLADDDVIEWHYTVDLGRDLGKGV